MKVERRSERRSVAVANASQTRPDQTRVVLTVCGGCFSGSTPNPSHRYLPVAAASLGFGLDR